MSAQSATRARYSDLALAAFLAPLLAGRRVAVVGTRSGDVAHRARALGAASVVCFGGVGEDIAVRALVPGALASFHGRLDVVIVPDAGVVPSLVALLDEARRALGSEGVLVVASEPDDAPRALEPNGLRGGADHSALRSLCGERFASVHLFGRGPFMGYLVGSLDEGADAVSLETRLIDGDPARPEAVVAVASDAGAPLDLLTVVQVPSQLAEQLGAGALEAAEAEHAKTRAKLKDVETASAERWVKIQRFEHGLKELEEENRKHRERAVKLSKELEDERKLRQRVELEAQMNRRSPELPKGPDPEVDKLKSELGLLQKSLDVLRDEAGAKEHQRESALAEATRGRKERDEARKERDEARKEREALKAEREALKTERDGLKVALDALKAEGETQNVEHARKLAAYSSAAAAFEAERKGLTEALGLAQGVSEALRSELDETQASEAELQAQVEALASRPKGDPKREAALKAELATLVAAAAAERASSAAQIAESTEEFAKLEARLGAAGAEIVTLRGAVTRAEGLVRELGFQLAERAAVAPPVTVDPGALAAVEAERDAARAALVEAEARGAAAASWQAEALRHASDAQRARWEVETLSATLETLRAQTAAPRAVATEAADPEPDDSAGLASLQREVEGLEIREAKLSGALRGMSTRVRELEHTLRELDLQLTKERSALEQQRIATHEARGEVARLYAINLGVEARMAHRSMELDGARAGYERRVAELQHEVERLLRALEVAGTQAAAEIGQQLDARERTLEGLRAEYEGTALRLREAEAAVSALTQHHAAQLGALGAEAQGLAMRLGEAETALKSPRGEVERVVEKVVTVAAEPAFDLAPPSPQGGFKLDQVMTDLNATALRLAETEEALAQSRAETARLGAVAGKLSADADARDIRFRGVMAQLDDRDRQVAALERRLRSELDVLSAQNRALVDAVARVREGISAILVDGRGAMVAHDLVGLLRAVESVG